MRIAIAITVFILTSHLLFAQKNTGSFRISGRLIGKDTGIIVLWYKDHTNTGRADTVQLQRGRFRFSGTVKGACEGLIFTDLKPPHLDHHTVIRFIIEPRSMRITKTYNDPHLIITGSAAQDEKAAFDNYKASLREKEEAVYKTADSLAKAGLPPDVQVKYTIDSVRKALRDLDVVYVAKHPNSYYSGYLLERRHGSLPADSLSLLYTALADRVKQSTIGYEVLKHIYQLTNDSAFLSRNLLRNKAFTEKLISIRSIHDLRLPGLSGDSLSLDDHKGKYLLIDVWASWCKPCIAGFPVWNKLVEKYNQSELRLIGVSLDIDTTAWRKAIQAHQPAGVQLIDTGGLYGIFGSYCRVLYLPRYVLADRDGRILNYDVDKHDLEAWEKYLDQLLSRQ